MAIILLDTSVMLDQLNGGLDRRAYLKQILHGGYSLGLQPGEETRTKAFPDDLQFYAVTREMAAPAGLLQLYPLP